MVLTEKPAPFAQKLPLPTTDQTKVLSVIEQGYRAWDATRRMNPYGQVTGFEGYFIGTKVGESSEAVAFAIAEMGASTLEAIKRLHRNDPSYVRKIQKVLREETFDLRMLADLNTYLMENIARLRVQIHPRTNPAGDAFHSAVADLVKGKKIEYLGSGLAVEKHRIPVPAVAGACSDISSIASLFSQERLAEGYSFMGILGKAGYPLARLAIMNRE